MKRIFLLISIIVVVANCPINAIPLLQKFQQFQRIFTLSPRFLPVLKRYIQNPRVRAVGVLGGVLGVSAGGMAAYDASRKANNDKIAAMHALRELPYYFPDNIIEKEFYNSSFERKSEHLILTKNSKSDDIYIYKSDAESTTQIGYISVRVKRNKFDNFAYVTFISIHPDYQRRGYASEAAKKILSIAFDELGLDYVVGEINTDNIASERNASKIGLTQQNNSRIVGSGLMKPWMLTRTKYEAYKRLGRIEQLIDPLIFQD
jgi:RimJ/RimL family protein N-acetyltransferase